VLVCATASVQSGSLKAGVTAGPTGSGSCAGHGVDTASVNSDPPDNDRAAALPRVRAFVRKFLGG
jgi:hypothetical protein